jgi:flagellar hook-associated protein 3 FlgL
MSGTLSTVYNNISFALHLHTDALSRLQEQASTGSRINRPSDDSSSAYQVLGLNSQERSMENYIDTLAEVISTLEYSSTVVEEMISYFTQVQTRLTQITSGVYDEDSRKRTAEEINDILEHMVLLANTERMGQHLFGGGDTASAPYVVQRTDGEITSVNYQGSDENRNTEVGPGVQSSAYYVGDEIFCSDERSVPIFSGRTGAQAGTGTSNITGSVWLTVIHDGSNYKISIDDGASYVTVPAGGDSNQVVTDSRTGKILYVDTTGINNTGVELVRVPGTYDIFNTLITIRDVLRNEKGLSEAQLQELRGSLFDSVEEMQNLLVQNSVVTGTKIGFMDDLQQSLEQIKYHAEDEATRLSQADIAQVSIELSRREVLYEMSLSVAAKIMSLSLLDYLR